MSNEFSVICLCEIFVGNFEGIKKKSLSDRIGLYTNVTQSSQAPGVWGMAPQKVRNYKTPHYSF